MSLNATPTKGRAEPALPHGHSWQAALRADGMTPMTLLYHIPRLSVPLHATLLLDLAPQPGRGAAVVRVHDGRSVDALDTAVRQAPRPTHAIAEP